MLNVNIQHTWDGCVGDICGLDVPDSQQDGPQRVVWNNRAEVLGDVKFQTDNHFLAKQSRHGGGGGWQGAEEGSGDRRGKPSWQSGQREDWKASMGTSWRFRFLMITGSSNNCKHHYYSLCYYIIKCVNPIWEFNQIYIKKDLHLIIGLLL